VTRELCPTCRQPLPAITEELTPRELELLVAWWTLGSVTQAARAIGVTEQRAKNMLARARIRSGVDTNDQLLARHMDEVRVTVRDAMRHNYRGAAA
jgi:hypothetical protein